MGSWAISCLHPRQEEEVPHANHFLLSLPRSPEVPGVGRLEGGRCWTSRRAGTARGGAPERWGDVFQQMCPCDLLTSVCSLLPGVSEAEGGVCKSVSLAAIIQPFPHLSPSLEYSLSSQGTLSPICAVLSVLLSSPEPSRKSRSLCLL